MFYTSMRHKLGLFITIEKFTFSHLFSYFSLRYSSVLWWSGQVLWTHFHTCTHSKLTKMHTFISEISCANAEAKIVTKVIWWRDPNSSFAKGDGYHLVSMSCVIYRSVRCLGFKYSISLVIISTTEVNIQAVFYIPAGNGFLYNWLLKYS